MKTLLLNVYEDTLTVIDIEPELEAYYKALDCDCVDVVVRKIGRRKFDVMRDDEGLLKANAKISAIDNLGRTMLVGNLMFFHHDGLGNLFGLSHDDIDHLTKCIQVMYTKNHPEGYKMVTQCEYA